MRLFVCFRRHHLKNCRLLLVIPKTSLQVFALFWGSIEATSFFVENVRGVAENNWQLFVIMIILSLLSSLLYLMYKSHKMLSVKESIERRDASIEIRVDNMFKLKGDLVMATNTSFHMSTTPGFEKGLQSQFVKEYYNNRHDHFRQDIDAAINKQDYSAIGIDYKDHDVYEIGSVVEIEVSKQLKKRTVYFLAIDELDEEGGYKSSYENIRKGLNELWVYLGNRSEPGEIIIPLIGTKSAGMVDIPKRDAMIVEIINSFLKSIYSEKKFCEKLIIVINENDYINQNIDLQELGNYLHIHATRKRWEVRSEQQPTGELI